MKSIRANPTAAAPEGDERIRTAVPAPSTDPSYESRGEHRRVVPSGDMRPLSDLTDPVYEQLIERIEAFEHALTKWEECYPESVFPPLVAGELAHAMQLCNTEDKNQSARLYAEWARHIVKCIRHEVEATSRGVPS